MEEINIASDHLKSATQLINQACILVASARETINRADVLRGSAMEVKISEIEPLPDLRAEPYQIPTKSIILTACDTDGNYFDDFKTLYPRAHGKLSQWCEYPPHFLSKLAWQASRLGTTYLVPPPDPFSDFPFDLDLDFTRRGREEHKQHYVAYLFTSKGRRYNISTPHEILVNTRIALADLERQLGMKSWVDARANDSDTNEIYTLHLNSAFGVPWGWTKRILEQGGYAMTVARLGEKHEETLAGDGESFDPWGPTFPRGSSWCSEYEKTTSGKAGHDKADSGGTEPEQNTNRAGDEAAVLGQEIAVGDEAAILYDAVRGLRLWLNPNYEGYQGGDNKAGPANRRQWKR